MMPTVNGADGLSEGLSDFLSHRRNGATFALTDDVEALLNSLAVRQPYLDDVSNHYNRALFLEVTNWLAAFVYGRQAYTLEQAMPRWLEDLIAYWHANESTVLTLVSACSRTSAILPSRSTKTRQ